MAMGEARVPLLRDRPAPPHHEPVPMSPVAPAPADPHRALGRGTAVVTSLLAGAIAGAIAKTVIAPLDRTKINFQISQTPYSCRAAVEFIVRCARTEGTRALWRGNSATMARIVPYAAIQFTAHEQWKRVLGVDTPRSAHERPVVHLVAGSLAGVTSQSATYPLDLARARMAVTSAVQYRTLRAVFVNVVRDEGLATLYRGYPATVLGVIPYAGVSFFTYDTFKHKYLEYYGTAQGPLVNVLFGGAAGALAQTASYPLDIVRRRMQTASPGHYATIADTLRAVYRSVPPVFWCPPGTNSSLQTASYPLDIVRRRMQTARAGHYATIADTLRAVYSAEGWRGFFKGLSMNWVKGPVAVGISFATYDAVKGRLRDLALALDR